MLSLAAVLLVHPQAMDSMRGSLVVFAGTAGLCVFAVVLDRVLKGSTPEGRGAHA